MEQEYSERGERYSESYSEPYRERIPRSDVDILVERLDRLIIAIEKQQESHDRLMGLVERQMTVIERLLLR
jgi:hypothetical protein